MHLARQAIVKYTGFFATGSAMTNCLLTTELSLPLLHRGKVRDIYEVDDSHMLIITTDRISAFDVIMPNAIPGKGEVLTHITRFWQEKLGHIVPNHISNMTLEEALPVEAERELVRSRSMVVKKLRALQVEAIVRGYIIGTGWKDYRASGSVCSIALPDGLKLADQLPEPLYTPSTKANVGDHDENIDFAGTEKLLGNNIAKQVRDISLSLYKEASAYALERGIIIADTKFEFGLDENNTVTLIDEALTPDSSRFWPVSDYQPGSSPISFDKQFVRDYLETLDWNKTAPAPELPEHVVVKTAEKYQQALDLLTGD